MEEGINVVNCEELYINCIRKGERNKWVCNVLYPRCKNLEILRMAERAVNLYW